MATNAVHEAGHTEGGEASLESDGAINAHATHCGAAAAFHVNEPTLTQLVEEGLDEAAIDDDLI